MTDNPTEISIRVIVLIDGFLVYFTEQLVIFLFSVYLEQLEHFLFVQ